MDKTQFQGLMTLFHTQTIGYLHFDNETSDL